MARVIQISFDELSQELFDWVVKQNKKPLSWLGREALECLRLFGSLENARIAKAMLLVAANEAYQSEVVDTEMESSLIGSDGEYADKADWVNSRLNEWRGETIETGKGLR